METSAESAAVLVLTCDKYADVARPFFSLWERHWPKCGFAKLVATDGGGLEERTGWKRVLCSGGSWSDVARVGLSELDTKWVVVFLEEFWICDRVREERVREAIAFADRRKALCVRLFDRPFGNGEISGGFREHLPGSFVRASLQAAIWDREKLRELLVPGESAWDFESRAGPRAEEKFPGAGIFAPMMPLIRYEEATQAGKWKQRAIWLCNREGIPIDFRRGKLMP